MLRFFRKRNAPKPAHIRPRPEVRPPPSVLRVQRLATQGIKPISIGTTMHIERLDISLVPLELIYYIVDFLWYDTDALRACSLVCTSWRPAQAHIFDSIVLHRGAAFASLIQTFEDHPALASHVRSLSILCEPEPGTMCYIALFTEWVPSALEELGRRCTAVRELNIHGYRHEEHYVLAADLQMTLCTRFPSIRRLTFGRVQFVIEDVFSFIISEFKQLSFLGLSDVMLHSPQQEAASMRTSTLSTFSLDTNDFPGLFMTMLDKACILDGAETLSVQMPVSDAPRKQLSKLLGTVKGSLKRLIIRGSTRFELPIDLAQHVGLEHLIFCDVWRIYQQPPDFWLGNILRTVQITSSLHEITFIVNYDHQPSEEADINWVAICPELERISGLARISVAYVAKTPPDRFSRCSQAENTQRIRRSEYEGACLANKARQEMSVFHERGLLRVYWSVTSTYRDDVTWILKDKYLS